MISYAGADWVAGQDYGKDMSPLGILAADLLGDVFQGIYHLHYLSSRALSRVTWSHPSVIEIVIGSALASVDSNLLTCLVVLAHDRALRVAISGAGPQYLRLTITQRQRGGPLHKRCPTMEEHIAWVRGEYGHPEN